MQILIGFGFLALLWLAFCVVYEGLPNTLKHYGCLLIRVGNSLQAMHDKRSKDITQQYVRLLEVSND